MSAAATRTDYHALLARQDWETLRQKLKLFAWQATGSRSMTRAEDLAHDAIARVWSDAGVRWNPESENSLLRFLTGIVRGDLSNERRLKRTSSEVATGPDALAEARDARPEPDAVLAELETKHVAFARLRERLAGDAIGGALVALFEDGIADAGEQASASGIALEDVRRARRRVFDHAAAVGREMEEVA